MFVNGRCGGAGALASSAQSARSLLEDLQQPLYRLSGNTLPAWSLLCSSLLSGFCFLPRLPVIQTFPLFLASSFLPPLLFPSSTPPFSSLIAWCHQPYARCYPVGMDRLTGNAGAGRPRACLPVPGGRRFQQLPPRGTRVCSVSVRQLFRAAHTQMTPAVGDREARSGA